MTVLLVTEHGSESMCDLARTSKDVRFLHSLQSRDNIVGDCEAFYYRRVNRYTARTVDYSVPNRFVDFCKSEIFIVLTTKFFRKMIDSAS